METQESCTEDKLPTAYKNLNDAMTKGAWVHNNDNEMTIVFTEPPHIVTEGDGDGEDIPISSDSDVFRSFREVHRTIGTFMEEHKLGIRWGLMGMASLLYVGYFIWALVVSNKLRCQDVRPLIGLTLVVVTLVTITLLRKYFKEKFARIAASISAKLLGKPSKIIKVCLTIMLILGVVGVLLSTIWQKPSNIVAMGGITFFILILWSLSAHPSKVCWRPVLGGLLLQFYFAMIILRWKTGYHAVMWLGQRIQIFLSFSDVGAKFVFGDTFADHFFAMKILPVVVFFSCAINVLYYLGVMQAVIGKIGWLLRHALGTTAPESVCAAANIFIGLSEAPIMIRPFLSLMTKSELNAVMTGGFATIAGGVMAAYISFGVPAEHLICASVMNAPCALAVAKLLYPETEDSQIKKVSDINVGGTEERNILEAAAAGASHSIMLVANIAANLIAFLAMLAFINAMLSWFGSFICHPDLTFQMICGYVFMPVAFLMGVDWKDAGIVGELIGMKTFLNEFVAYGELTEFMKNRASCTGPMISVRSTLIATYALCGFANLSGIGIVLGALAPMAPSRRGDLAETVMRSLLGGVVTSLITASVASLLLLDPAADLCADMTLNSSVTMATEMNSTMATNLTYLINATDASVVL